MSTMASQSEMGAPVVAAQTRRERERNALRERILQAAVGIAHREGWANVSMRRIAEALDYTAPALYYHFESKDALVVALRQCGYRLLLQRFERIRAVDPAARLAAIARRGADFAFDHPELFSAMFGLGGISCESPDAPLEARLVAGLVHQAARPLFGSARSQRAFGDEVDAFWASLHGIVALALAGPIEGGRTRARTLSQIVVTNTVQAWSNSTVHINTEDRTP